MALTARIPLQLEPEEKRVLGRRAKAFARRVAETRGRVADIDFPKVSARLAA